MLCCTFYIAWECWLKDKIIELMLDYCCCGLGEYILSFMECIGFIDSWREEREPRREPRENNKGRIRHTKIEIPEIEKVEEEIEKEEDNLENLSGTPRKRVVRRVFI